MLKLTNLIKNFILHSFNDNPCIVNTFCFEWQKNGIRHRDNSNPAYVERSGDFEYYTNGKYIEGYTKCSDGFYERKGH